MVSNRDAVKRLGIGWFLTLVMLVGACTSGEPAGSSTTSESGGTTAPVGTTTSEGPTTTAPSVDTSELVIVVGTLGADDWDPAHSDSSNAAPKGAIYDTLLRLDRQTREIGPGLVESWEQTPDGLVTTFKLREGVEFHDGWGPVTAADVLFTIKRFLGPTQDRSNPKQALMRAFGSEASIEGDYSAIEAAFEIVSPLEFTITSQQFEVQLLWAFADGATSDGMYIISEKYWTENPDEAMTHPIGTGPYQYVSSEPGLEVRLTAVDSHWRQTPTYENVLFQVIPDASARLATVQAGTADMAVIPGNLVREAQASGVNTLKAESYGIMSIILGGFHEGSDLYDPDAPWIQASEPEKGLAIRQALDLAIDREAILEAVQAGNGMITPGPILNYPLLPSRHDPSWALPVYDPELAQQKLIEGGYPDGFEIFLPSFESRPGSGQREVTEAVANYWEAIGITVDRRPITDEQADQITRPPNLQGTALVRLDPFMDESVQTFTCCYQPEGSHKLIFDPVFDEARAALPLTVSAEERERITKEVIEYLIETKKAIPLLTFDWHLAVSDKVGSWDNLASEGQFNSIETIQP